LTLSKSKVTSNLYYFTTYVQESKVKIAVLRNPLQWISDLYAYLLYILGVR